MVGRTHRRPAERNPSGRDAQPEIGPISRHRLTPHRARSPRRSPRRYPAGVALVRILIDGYSLLHAWRELSPRNAPHSAGAREALLAVLTQYQDACGIPLTVFFDGQGAPSGTPKTPSTRQVEVLYSRAGQTADDMIERTAYRMKPFGEVLAVTDDHAECDTVMSVGGLVQSCDSFVAQIRATLGEMAEDVKHHNRRERERFRRGE